MGKHGRKAKQSSILIDCRRLDGGNLVLAKALADDIKPAREGGISERAVRLAGKRRPDRRNERLFRIDHLGLRLGEIRCDRGN
jgi:hypothetical protein